MGGVAGSAGVFTTAADVARYARMVLAGGTLDGVRILSPDSVRLLTTVQSPPGVAPRGMGMDIDSPYAVRPRGTLFPVGSFGHTGFTGCILWIDPGSHTFYVFLSNRVYPDDKSNVLALYTKLGTLSAEAGGVSAAGTAVAVH
jgi:CubicO group peptidase (beta-lactamase class C family)